MDLLSGWTIESMRGVFDTSPVATLVVGFSSGRVLDANLAACRLFGVPAEVLVGRLQSSLGLTWPSLPSGFWAVETESASDPISVRSKVSLQRTNGEIVQLEAVDSPLPVGSASAPGERVVLRTFLRDPDLTIEVELPPTTELLLGVTFNPGLLETAHDFGSRRLVDECGRPAGAEGTAIDVTELKAAKEALRRREEQYRLLFSEMMSAVALHEIICDSDGVPVNYRFLAVNAAFERFTGLKSADVVGRTVLEVLPQTETFWIERYGRVALSGEPVQFEEYSEALDRYYEVRAYCLECGKFAVIFNDITDRKRAEERLLRTQKLESLGVVAGGIAHDFNNLLGGLFGYLDLTRSALDEGAIDCAKSAIDKANAAYDRARSLTTRLLTFSRGDVLQRKPLSLEALVRSIVEFVLSGSPVPYSFASEEGLWSCVGDEGQIGRVIENLVINAMQSLEKPSPIEISLANLQQHDSLPEIPAGRYVTIRVCDHGRGIAKSDLCKIFDPFFTSKTDGSGLGLAVCHSIVGKHGGWIDVDSDPVTGTCFSVHLPASDLSEVLPTSVSTKPQVARLRVLVMDDEPFLREVIQRFLEIDGHEVVTVCDGEAAVDAFGDAQMAGTPFDLVIADLTVVGGMGGREAAQAILALNSAARIIATSGYSSDAILTDPTTHGFVAALKKPFRRQDLQEVLVETLGTKVNEPGQR